MSKELRVYCPTMARFNAALEAGEIDDTQEVYIVEIASLWKNGKFHPYVYLDDYLKKGEAIDFANDLTGVQEATPEEFTFRTSAGTKSIRDESAVIRRIKGNTSMWGQYAKNPIFTDGTANWASNGAALSANSNGGVNFVTTSTSSQSIGQVLTDAIPKGHKVLIVIDYKRNTTTSLDVLFYLRKSSGGFDQARIYSVADNNRRVDSVIISTTDAIMSTTSASLLVYPMMNGASGLTAIIYSINVFDLTAIFGAGNEPATLAKFKEVYPESYYPYCAPEVRSMRATGIETIGFNAYNGEYAEVLGGMQYCLCGDFTSVGFSDTIGGEITEIAIPEDKIYVPSRKGYIYASGSDICIHLVHSGVCNGEYHDYWKSVRMLPDIATYFPDGMHGIGRVFDEINEESAVKRFGVVDLGTLTWYETPTKTGARRFGANGIRELAEWASANNVSANIVCVKYDRGTADDTYLDRHCIAIDRVGSIFVYDPNYNTTGSLTNFVASLQGVLLYYELAEPIVTPITEPLQLDYKVADFGTEKMLSDLPSSPFRADIVYQFNAEGRIRDNARNIERLEEHTKNMATMEDVINAIPTEVATATQRSESLGASGNTSISPNIMYEYYAGLGQFSSFVLPTLFNPSGDYDHVWMMRLPSIATSSILSYPYSIKWKDGVAPTFSEACSLEIYLKKANTGEILGEWKIYR